MSELLEFLRLHEEAFRSRARLASLYSDFRYQRSSNLDGYQANVATWYRALKIAAQAGQLPSPAAGQSDHFVVHSGNTLAQALQLQEFGRPLALGAVFDEAVRKKEWLPLKGFLDAKSSVYTRSWVPSVGDVVSWGLRQLGVGGGDGDGGGVEERLKEGDFVLLASLEAAADRLQRQFATSATSRASRVFSRDMFTSTVANALDMPSLSSTDLSVLLRFLTRDRSIIFYSPASGVIKLKAAGEIDSPAITEEDITIASLRNLLASMKPQVEQLEGRRAKLEKEAREAVTSKNLTRAKTALRMKKLVETTLTQRTETVFQLEQVYYNLEEAADQVEMVRVMEAAGQSLKSLNKQTGGVDKVQDVMDDLREQMMDVEEIGQALHSNTADEVDEGEIEDELEAMEKIEREKREAAERKIREEKEAAEAEETRKKFAELDQMGEKAKADEVTTPPNEPLRPFEEKKDSEKVAS